MAPAFNPLGSIKPGSFSGSTSTDAPSNGAPTKITEVPTPAPGRRYGNDLSPVRSVRGADPRGSYGSLANSTPNPVNRSVNNPNHSSITPPELPDPGAPSSNELIKREEYAARARAFADIQEEAARAAADGVFTADEAAKLDALLQKFKNDPQGLFGFVMQQQALMDKRVSAVHGLASVAMTEAEHAEKHVTDAQTALQRAGLADSGSAWENLGNNSLWINGAHFPTHVLFLMGMAAQSTRYFVDKPSTAAVTLGSISEALWRNTGNEEVQYAQKATVYNAGDAVTKGKLLPADVISITGYVAAGLPVVLGTDELNPSATPACFSAYSHDDTDGITFTVAANYRVVIVTVSRGVIAGGWDSTTWIGFGAMLWLAAYSGKAAMALFVLFPWLRNTLLQNSSSHVNTAKAA